MIQARTNDARRIKNGLENFCRVKHLELKMTILRSFAIIIAYGGIAATGRAELPSPHTMPVFTSLEEALKVPYEVYALDLSYNPLTELPAEIGRLTRLRALKIRCSRLQRLPEALGKLWQLEVLNIGGMMDCELRVDGRWIANTMMPRIENLEIIRQLRNLREFRIGFMEGFQELPEAFCTLPRLQHLAIQFSDLAELPSDIGDLTSLTRLTLCVNHIARIPGGIGQLELLEELNLKDNRLTTLPDEIKHLRRLKVLRLGNGYNLSDKNNFSSDEKRRIQEMLPTSKLEF